MHNLDFSPLYLPITKQDKLLHGSSPSWVITTFGETAILLIGVSICVLFSLATGAIDVSLFSSPIAWLVIVGIVLLCMCAIGAVNYKEWMYELRLKKFVALHAFTFTPSQNRSKGIFDEEPDQSKKTLFKTKRIHYDSNIVSGTYLGHAFTLGTRILEYSGGEGTTIKTAYLRMQIAKDTKSRIVLLGDGKAINKSDLRNFTIQRPGLTPRFKVFSLQGQPWQKIIPVEFQKKVLQIKQPIDIEVDGAFVTFYAANKFNLKLLPQLFELISKTW